MGSRDGAQILSSYGKKLEKLERVVGVNECCVREGELRHILFGDTGSLTAYHESCTRLSGPPGDMYQAYNWGV